MTQNCPFEPEAGEVDASNAVPPPEHHAVDLMMETLAHGGLTAFDDEETIARKTGRRGAWPVRLQPRTARFAALTVMAFAIGAAQTIWILRRVPAETAGITVPRARVVKNVASVPIGSPPRPPIEPRAVPVVAAPAAPQQEPASVRSVERARFDPLAPSMESARANESAADTKKAAAAAKQTTVDLARSVPPVERVIVTAPSTPSATAVPLPPIQQVARVSPPPARPLAEALRVEPNASEPLDMAAAATPSVSENHAAMQVPTPALAPTDDTREIEMALGRYKQAYNALDVAATSQVWPTVERRSLARAFATLKSQSVAFASCEVRVQGFSAVARCDGTVQFVRAVGNADPRVERQQWTFQLRKLAGQWRIDDVVAAPQGRAARAVVDSAPTSVAMRQNAALAPSAPAPPRH